jgi:uncharacterized protein YjbJ (UPF0337 family)
VGWDIGLGLGFAALGARAQAETAAHLIPASAVPSCFLPPEAPAIQASCLHSFGEARRERTRRPSSDGQISAISEAVMNRDEMEGKGENLKGKIKETTGDVTGDERMKSEGKADQAAGKAQEKYGEGKRKVGEAVEDLGDKIGS